MLRTGAPGAHGDRERVRAHGCGVRFAVVLTATVLVPQLAGCWGGSAVPVSMCAPSACEIVPGRAYLWQTNSEGDDAHIIDIASRSVVGRVVLGPQPHGIAAPRLASVVYITTEANGHPNGDLIALDSLTLEEIFRIPVGREPHAIAVTADGRWVYVPCRDGHYWVVDTQTRTVAARIRTDGRPHNTSISRDGRLAFLSPMGEPKRVTIVDIAAGHRVVGEIPFSASTRPPALAADASLLFHHVDGLNGFEVADTSKRRVVARIEHSTPLRGLYVHGKLGWLSFDGFQRCHGLAVRPGETEVWSTCGEGVTIHNGRAPFDERSWIPLRDDAYWLTFSPDGKYAFIPIPGRREVAMVDASARKVVSHIPVGDGPKRNLVIVPPAPAAGAN